MSKRRGDVVFLDEFVDEIGVDAARWYLLSRGHDQTIEIDVDLAAERSQKNPVYYVQYAHARIAGVLRNAGERPRTRRALGALAGEERELVKRLLELPEVVREATARRAPHAIPTYAIRVADDFHRFYHEHKVLGSDAETLPPRALHGDAERRGDVPRPARDRGARAHVGICPARGLPRAGPVPYHRPMRWNLALGALAASWGFIAVLAASVELGAEALAFWRLAPRRTTLACRRRRRDGGSTCSARAAARPRSRCSASCRAPTGCSSSRLSSTARWRSLC